MSEPDLCTECGRPLDDGDEVQRAIDGSGIHAACLQDLIERLHAKTDEGDDA